MKRTAIVYAAGAIVLAGALLIPAYGGWMLSSDGTGGMPICAGGRCCCRLKHSGTAGEALAADQRPTLDPKQFVGEVRKAYEAAGAHPDLFVQLHCYCGCDVSAGHKSLLDCYRDHHGATCAICTGEALQATQMYAEGSPVEQIQDALRRRFAGKE
jgi:Protein of unknown function with PCYCGC motif